ncbi:MAG: hypothetical protein P8186_32830 [Anaerolineae bacterium]
MRRFFIALILLTLVGCATSPNSTMPPKDKELSRASNLARAAFEDGATTKAIDLYRKALNRALAMDDATEIGNIAYNLALCHILMGQLDQASVSLAEAKAEFKRNGSSPADVLLLEATVALRQGRLEQALSLANEVLSARSNAAAASTGFLSSKRMFPAKHYRDMALALQRAGEAYQKAGDRQHAEDRLFRAKRSLAAQGEKTE